MTHNIPHEHPHRGDPPDTCGHYVAACKVCGIAWCKDCGKVWTPEQVQEGRWTQTPPDATWNSIDDVEGTA